MSGRLRSGEGLVEVTFPNTASCGGQAVAMADYDGDGLVDVLMSGVDTGSANCLLRRTAEGSFERVDTASWLDVAGHPRSYGFAFADYDGDGLVDLFVVYGADTTGRTNQLFRQTSGVSYTRVETGDIATDSASSYGAAWGDYNVCLCPQISLASCTDLLSPLAVHCQGDGCLDLVVANKDEVNFLYRQDAASDSTCSATFTRQTSSVVEAPTWESYNAAWAE